MEPIGLVFKDRKYNPYKTSFEGELMIVHLCLNCGKVSCNRIAGDDNSQALITLLEKSNNLDKYVATTLTSQGIKLLTKDNKKEVVTCLYGLHYQE